MKTKLFLIFNLIFFMILMGCSKKETEAPISTAPSNYTNNKNTLTAKINGISFSDLKTRSMLLSNFSTICIIATSNNQGIGIFLNQPAIGEFIIDTLNKNGKFVYFPDTTSSSTKMIPTNGAIIKITQYKKQNDTTIAVTGSFSFKIKGANGVEKEITEGYFSVLIPVPPFIEIATNKKCTVSFKVDGKNINTYAGTTAKTTLTLEKEIHLLTKNFSLAFPLEGSFPFESAIGSHNIDDLLYRLNYTDSAGVNYSSTNGKINVLTNDLSTRTITGTFSGTLESTYSVNTKTVLISSGTFSADY